MPSNSRRCSQVSASLPSIVKTANQQSCQATIGPYELGTRCSNPENMPFLTRVSVLPEMLYCLQIKPKLEYSLDLLFYGSNRLRVITALVLNLGDPTLLLRVILIDSGFQVQLQADKGLENLETMGLLLEYTHEKVDHPLPFLAACHPMSAWFDVQNIQIAHRISSAVAKT